MCLYDTRQLTKDMRAVRAGTIRIAEEIPESQYDYRPTPESRSVSETLVHIAWLASFDRHIDEGARVSSLDGFDFGAAIEQSRAQELERRSKGEIIERLRAEGERHAAWVEQIPEPVLQERVGMPGGGSANRFELLLGTKEHEMHHRGQPTVLRRLIGAAPRAS